MDDDIARSPDCDGQAADAVSAFTRVKEGRRSKIAQKIRSQNVQMYGYVFHDTHGQHHGQTLKILWFLSNEICTVSHLEASCGKDSLKKLYSDLDGTSTELGCLFVHRKRGLFLSVYVDDIKMAGKNQNLAPMWKKLMKNVDLDEPTSFLDHVYLGCSTQRECKPKEIIVEEYTKMFRSRVSAGATEKLPGCEKPHAKTVAWSYDMEGHARQCVERYCELANKKVEQLQVLAWMITNSRRKNLNRLENYQKYAHKLS